MKNFKPLSMARPIIGRHHVRALSSGQSSQLISYNSESGLYTVDEQPIRRAAQAACFGSVKEYHIREILSAVRRNAPVIDPWDVNNPKQRIIVFRNGVFDLPSGELQEHSPKWLYTIGIPHKYNPEAQCPRFKSFISEVLPREAHRFVKQLLGYLLIPSAEFRKFVVFLGEGANGKSTLLLTIEAMLGTGNISHQSLHSLGDNRFAAFGLFGKLANIYSDLEDSDVRKVGLLKQITAGDTIAYERKFRDPFSAPVTAMLVYSANRMPHIPDESEAIGDRLILLEFKRRFEEAQQDKQLIHKLTEEIEGILARWAVPGLKDLLSTGQFDIPVGSRQLLSAYCGQRDPFLAFVSQRLEVASEAWLGKSDLFEHYKSWCGNHAVKAMSNREFNRRISEHFRVPNNDWRTPGTRQRAWPDLQFKQIDASLKLVAG